jgi:hypothetical protein
MRGTAKLTAMAKKNHNGAKIATGRAIPAYVTAASSSTATHRIIAQRRVVDIGFTWFVYTPSEPTSQ